MLQFQSGDYCICIWDTDRTELAGALRSLAAHVDDEGCNYTLSVTGIGNSQGTDMEKAVRILTLASGICGALQYEGRETGELSHLIAAIVVACMQFAESIGCSAGEIQRKIDIVIKSLGGNENHDKTD